MQRDQPQSGGYNDEIEGKLKGILDSFQSNPVRNVRVFALGQAVRH